MNVTFHHPKVIQFFNTHKNVSPENILLAALPLLDICSTHDNNNTLSQLEILFNKFQENFHSSHSSLEKKLESSHSALENSFDKTNSHTKTFIENSLALHHSNIDNKINTISHNNELFHKLELFFKEQQSSFEKQVALVSNNNDTTHKIELLFKEQQSHFSSFFHSAFNDNNSLLASNLDSTLLKHISPLSNSLGEVHNNIQTFTLNSQNSSKKGAISENKLQNSLVLAFPNLPIIDSHKNTAAGDSIVQHNDCGNILIENKDYSHNVPSSEVDKFFRDVSLQKCHGIFISQSSGITLKDNFHVQFHHGFVTVFLHNVHYDHIPILYATNIIKALMQIAAIHSDNHIVSDSVIDNELLNNIYDDWKKHNSDKLNILSSLNSLIKNVKDLSIPALDNFIQNKFIVESVTQYKCSVCAKICKTKSALISHQKSKHPDSLCEIIPA